MARFFAGGRMARSSVSFVIARGLSRVILFIMLPALWTPPAPADEGTQQGELAESDLDARITTLIGQLGDPRFATRERARPNCDGCVSTRSTP